MNNTIVKLINRIETCKTVEEYLHDKCEFVNLDAFHKKNRGFSGILQSAEIEEIVFQNELDMYQKKYAKLFIDGDFGSKLTLKALNDRHFSFVNPYDGKVCKTTKSLGHLSYYFIDERGDFIVTFYSSWSSGTADYQIFFIDNNIIVYTNDKKLHAIHRSFKNLLVFTMNNKDIIVNYIKNKQREVMLSNIDMKHIAHSLWNGLGDWTRYSKLDIIDNIDYVSPMASIFDTKYYEFEENINKKVKEFKNVWQQEKYCLNNNIFLLTLKSISIPKELGITIKKNIKKHFLTDIKKSKILDFRTKNFPIVLIGLRCGNREWVDQEAGYINVIKKLYQDFPYLGIIIDGMSAPRDGIAGSTHGMIDMDREIDIAYNIIEECSHNGIECISLVGSPIHDCINWLNVCDMFVVPWGAGLAKYKWISNMEGVIFSNKAFLSGRFDLRIYDTEKFLENAIECKFLDKNYVEDLPNKDKYRANFKIDWEYMYNEVKQELDKISERKNLQIQRSLENLL